MLNPYKYTHESSGALYFSTDAGREYRAFLVEGDGYFPAYPNISANMFVFCRDTILTVIIEYLTQHKDNGLIYICDTKHRAGISRNLLFTYWESAVQVSITKHGVAIHDSDGNPSAYVSLLILNTYNAVCFIWTFYSKPTLQSCNMGLGFKIK